MHAQLLQLRKNAEAFNARMKDALYPEVKWWKRFQVDLPVKKVGDWAIHHYDITPGFEFFRIMQSGREVHPGRFTRLVQMNPHWCGTCQQPPTVVMSDVPAEIGDHLPFIETAYGDVIIFGLGLGMVVRALRLFNSNVRTVTVVEKNKEVIAMVEPELLKLCNPPGVKAAWLQIVHANAYTWEPGFRHVFDAAFFDIWNEISPKNYPMMVKLKRRYRRMMRNMAASPMMCWMEELCAMTNEQLAEKRKKKYEEAARAFVMQRRRLIEKWKLEEQTNPWKEQKHGEQD